MHHRSVDESKLKKGMGFKDSNDLNKARTARSSTQQHSHCSGQQEAQHNNIRTAADSKKLNTTTFELQSDIEGQKSTAAIGVFCTRKDYQ